eukprot:scaffold11431_cov118-Isochrysis_galbana.AAC.1
MARSKSPRTVPGSARDGSASPIRARLAASAPAPRHRVATTGPAARSSASARCASDAPSAASLLGSQWARTRSEPGLSIFRPDKRRPRCCSRLQISETRPALTAAGRSSTNASSQPSLAPAERRVGAAPAATPMAGVGYMAASLAKAVLFSLAETGSMDGGPSSDRGLPARRRLARDPWRRAGVNRACAIFIESTGGVCTINIIISSLIDRGKRPS